MAMKPTDQEIGMLYRESGEAEPSAELDRNILAAARAAVAAKPAPSPWWTRWRLPVQALASVAVLAMLVVMVLQKQPDAPVIGELALNAQPTEAPVQAVPPVMEKSMPAAADKDFRVAERAAVRSAPAAAPAAPAASAAAPLVVPPAAKSEVLASSPAAEARAPMAAAPALRSQQGDEVSGAAEAGMATRQASALPVRPAKEWLESIQLLVSQGRIEEAKSSLAAFERAHPSVVVPDGLRKQLK